MGDGCLGLQVEVISMTPDPGRQQSQVFGEVAEIYHLYRPGYPKSLFEWILTTCEPSTTELVVDIGCGTGKASGPLLRHGFEILGLEPDPEMARIAAREFKEFDLFSVEEYAFEDWPNMDRKVGLLIAGQSWHWTNPELRFQRAASILQPEGWLCVFWNRPDYDKKPFDAEVDRIYAELVPEFDNNLSSVRLPGSKAAITADSPTEEINMSGLFDPVQELQIGWEIEISTHHHIQNLRTQSDHRMLEPGLRDELFRQISEAINACGGIYRQTFTTHAYAAKLSV